MNKIKPQITYNYFIGIDIPVHIKEEISYFCNTNMKNFNVYMKWINFHEYHMTLAFIGKITPEQRERLISASDQIILPPFTVNLQGIGFFPPGNKPKTLWIGIGTGREKINVFGNKIREEISKKSGLLPKDNFFPHVTISKINSDPENKHDLYKFVKDNWNYPFGSFKVENFHLYRITKEGYVYNHEVKLRSKSKLLL